jgi:outer membrane murein-binding lipoprotein Lpp
MFKRLPSIRLHAYCIFCALLIGCSSPGGNYDLGKADAQIGGLVASHPELAKELNAIRTNLKAAEVALQSKEKTIDNLSEVVALEREKSTNRLTMIWKLTSILLGILLIVGTFIAWKLR